MSSLKDLASLIMIPSLYKDGRLDTVKPLGNSIIHPDATGNNDGTDGSTPAEGNFTFSRGSNLAATRVDVNGLIEKGRENLLTYSNDFSKSIWVKSFSSVTSGQADRNGGTNAFILIPSTLSTSKYIYQNNYSITGINTGSVYVKYSGYHAQLRVYGIGGGKAYANFDLQNGTKGTSGGDSIVDSTVTSIGNDWYRVTFTINHSGSYNVGIGPIPSPTSSEHITFAGDGTSGIFLQDFQLEAGLVATDYIETGASTAQAGILEDMPRLDYSGSCPALLLEPQRTNVLEQSEYYNAYFTRNNVSLTDNATTSTEGLQNASKLIPDNGTGGNRSVGKTFSGLSGIHTFSVFAKAAEYGYVSLRMRNAPSNFVMFDLSDGSVYNTNSSGNQYVDNSAKVEDYGNGWYRLSASYDPSESETAGTLYPSLSVGITGDETSSFNGDGTSGIYIYGMQFEAGSYPTSYIPTYGSSVTRSKDHCLSSSLTASTDFTIFFEAPDFCLINGSTGGVFSNIQFVFSSNGSSYPVDGSYHIYNNSLYYWNGSTNTSFGVIYNNQTDSKFALVKRGDSMIVFANGSKVNEVTLPSGSDAKAVNWDTISLSEGSLTDAQGDVFNPYYKQLAKFDTALTDSECIALTTL